MDQPHSFPIGGLLVVWATGMWLFLFCYNVGICRLERSLLKVLLQRIDILVFVVLVPVLSVVFRHVPWVAQVLALAPASAAASIVLAGMGAVWVFALSCQAAVTGGIVRPPRTPSVISRRRTRAAYRPALEDWDHWRETPRPGPTDETASAAPACRRRVRPVRVSSVFSKIRLSPLFRAVDQCYDLRLDEFVVHTPALPAAFSPLRIVHLADIHYGVLLSPGYFRHAIDLASRQRADLILLSGDFTASDNLYRESVELFSGLECPLGLWAVRGNHDHNTEPGVVAHWLERSGVRLLANRSVDLVRGEETLRLTGVEHPSLPVRDWPALMETRTSGASPFRIALSHTPDNAGRLAALGADLILAGHTHGGQWRLPLLGPLAVPSVYGRRFSHGLHPLGGALLSVSAGIGVHTIPLRLNCPPELIAIELRRQAPGASSSPD